MLKINFLSLALLSCLMIAPIAFSHDHSEEAGAEAKVEGTAAPEGKPCDQVKAACEAAGFEKNGQKDKKGLHKDCMKQLFAGNAVDGVTVAPEVLSACKDRKGDHKKRK